MQIFSDADGQGPYPFHVVPGLTVVGFSQPGMVFCSSCSITSVICQFFHSFLIQRALQGSAIAYQT